MVLAHPDVPAKNLPELFAYAKANPDKLAIATDGARRFSGMIAAWLNKLAGTNISYVPYTQMTQGVQDVHRRPRAAHHPRCPDRQAAMSPRQASPAGGDVAASGCRTIRTCRPSPRPFRASTSPAGSCWRRRPACRPTIVARVNREMDGIMKDPAVVEQAREHAASRPRRRHAERRRSDYVQAQHAAWGTLVKEIGLQPE